MLDRTLYGIIREDLSWSPVVAIVGPRQVGKTTLAKSLLANWEQPTLYLDLELESDRRKLEDAETYLGERSDYLIAIDEIQLKPELFNLLRALIDQDRRAGRFLLLGSASPHIVKQVTETLAGRIAYHELTPLSRSETMAVVPKDIHWLWGGFPNALLSPSERISRKWLEDFVETFVQRDLTRLGYTVSLTKMRQLIRMLAHVNGDVLNQSTLGRSLSVSAPTVARYLELLEGSFLIRRLPPYYVNVKKQLVKSPKIFVRDTGLLHHLLRISNYEQLLGHPAVGNSWEAFVIEQIIRQSPEFSDFFFYRTRSGAEIDLLIIRPNGERWAIEVKRSNSPRLTKGFFIALEDVGAKRAFVLTPGSDVYSHGVAMVCGLEWFLSEILG